MSAPAASTALLAAHWVLVVALSLRVISRRSPVGVSMAWLAVAFSLPFVGAVLYLMFGERRVGPRRRRRIEARRGEVERLCRELLAFRASVGGDASADLARQAEVTVGIPPVAAHRVELLTDDDASFDRLVADVDAARESCDLGFYIWSEGGRVADVVDALVRAAGRGVRCRAIADSTGSEAFLASDSARRLRAAGVRLVAALPTGLLRSVFARADLRNHRKIAVVDGRIAYTGSRNLVDPRFFKREAGVGAWIDAMVRFEGPAAAVVRGVFAFDWSLETNTPFDPALPEREESAGEDVVPLQVVPSGPDLHPEAIHELLLTSIYAARRELVMTTPYFVPDESILTALLSAARRGVAVTLVVPRDNDSVLVRYASAATYEALLAAGVRVALFAGGLLHTKSLCVDGAFCVFGSVNLDMRSLWLNHEISLFVHDADFTARLRALQDAYVASAEDLDLATWRRRPRRQRLAEDACRLVGPLL
ncbi:MAG: cardiolipin synthase [Planctomycetota bacterium]